MTLAKFFLGLGFVGIAGTLSGTALAQTCTTDADCVAGYTCKTEVVNTATTAPCAPDADCTATTVPRIAPTTVSYCAPKACATDTDCGAGMICHSTTTEACSGGTDVACEKGTTCLAPPPPTCTTITTAQCMYPWQLPCKADEECGEGFRCQPTTYGMCSGSSGVGGATSGDTPAVGGGIATATDVTLDTGAGGATGFAPTDTSVQTGTTTERPLEPIVPPSVGGATSMGGAIATPGTGGSVATGGSIAMPPRTGTTTCTTVTQYPGSCVPKATSCAVDADCPSPFVCQTRGTITVGTGGMLSATPDATTSAGTGTATGSAPVSTNHIPVIATDPPVETVVKTCVSPFAVNGTTEIGIKGGTTSTTDLTPLTPNDATATGTSRDTTTGTGPGTTTLPPAGTESADAPSGGCQVGQGSAGTVWGLSLLGLVGLVARRRRRG